MISSSDAREPRSISTFAVTPVDSSVAVTFNKPLESMEKVLFVVVVFVVVVAVDCGGGD